MKRSVFTALLCAGFYILGRLHEDISWKPADSITVDITADPGAHDLGNAIAAAFPRSTEDTEPPDLAA